MDYFTSDEHFDHVKIIEYCNRPFSSVYEMNNFMIEQWNNIVNDRDTVYVLDDFCNCYRCIIPLIYTNI